MPEHRNPHPRLSKAPPTDNLMDEARRRLGEADALASAAAVAIRDASERLDRNRLAYLVGLTAEAVAAAATACADLIAVVERAMPMEAP